MAANALFRRWRWAAPAAWYWLGFVVESMMQGVLGVNIENDT